MGGHRIHLTSILLNKNDMSILKAVICLLCYDIGGFMNCVSYLEEKREDNGENTNFIMRSYKKL